MTFKEFTINYFMFGICISILLSIYGTIGLDIFNDNLSIKENIFGVLYLIYLLTPYIILFGLYLIIAIGYIITNFYKTWWNIRNFDIKIIGYLDILIELKDNEQIKEGIKELYKRVKKYYE